MTPDPTPRPAPRHRHRRRPGREPALLPRRHGPAPRQEERQPGRPVDLPPLLRRRRGPPRHRHHVLPVAARQPRQPGVGVVQETYLTVPHGTCSRGLRGSPPAARGSTRSPSASATASCPSPTPTACASRSSRAPTPFAFRAWDDGPVPASEQVRGLHGARAPLRELAPSERFLTRSWASSASARRRLGPLRAREPGRPARRRRPHARPARGRDGRRGAWGVGSVHHLAWTVDDDEHQVALRDAVARAGRRPVRGHRPVLVPLGVLHGAGRACCSSSPPPGRASPSTRSRPRSASA
jgi:hypothetical protein